MRVPSEHLEQVKFVSWFRRTYPTERILAVPNGEARSKSVGARLKAEGVSPGVPDLLIPKFFLWIEMKRTKGGSVTKNQKEWMEYLKGCGYYCVVCKGAEDAIETVKRWTNR